MLLLPSLYFSGSVRVHRLPPENKVKTCLPVIRRTGMSRYLFIKQRVRFGRKEYLRGYWMGSGIGHPTSAVEAPRVSGREGLLGGK